MLRQYNYMLLVVITGMILFGCSKKIDDPAFGEGDMPRIFQMGGNFRSSYIIEEGQSAVYSGLLFSPAGKVKISWKVNDKVVSSDTIFTFKPTGGGEFHIVLEAEFNGLVTTRTSTVLVKPSTYTPAPYNKVVMGYVTDAGLPSAVNWGRITHLAYQCGKVSAEGILDVTAGELNQKMDELVARGHINGKPVLLSIAGRLSGIDGWALYESRDFGDVIRNAEKRADLVNRLKNYLAAKRLDGVDIIMTDINGDPNYSANLAALGLLVKELRNTLPSGSLITCAVTTGWQHWEYPDLSAADWVNVHAFEDGIHVGPGAPRGQASSYDYMISCADIWKNFHLAPNKLVIGMPAFGLRYTAIDDNGNNASWGSYDYLSYLSVLGINPEAYSGEYLDAAKGIYYNGVPLISKKATYIKSAGYKGGYLWSIDYDSPATGKSLLEALYNGLQ
ncbi:MAG: hypothetical protein J7578_06190 [Chitinophagaceae bacterium]|nr:hypothetical protein [Chitinophagaceae bacterium]